MLIIEDNVDKRSGIALSMQRERENSEDVVSEVTTWFREYV